MKLRLVLATCLALPLVLTACSKQEKAPTSEQQSSSEVASNESPVISPEQQAAIDALDKPVQDEHNTDVPESVANAPADQATIDENQHASSAQ